MGFGINEIADVLFILGAAIGLSMNCFGGGIILFLAKGFGLSANCCGGAVIVFS